jgi:large subunit ribosomal protein L13Ae
LHSKGAITQKIICVGQSINLTVFSQRLSHEVGWGYKDVVDRLEEKRKIKAQAFHERKVRIIVVCLMLTETETNGVINQIAAVKLRQKAISDNTGSFEKLTQLGY